MRLTERRAGASPSGNTGKKGTTGLNILYFTFKNPGKRGTTGLNNTIFHI